MSSKPLTPKQMQDWTEVTWQRCQDEAWATDREETDKEAQLNVNDVEDLHGMRPHVRGQAADGSLSNLP